MPGGRIGGNGNMIQRTIWVFVAACIAVAVWNTMPHEPKAFMGALADKADQLKGVAAQAVDWLGIDPHTSDQPTQDKNPKPDRGRSGNSGGQRNTNR